MKILHIHRKCHPADTNHSCKTSSSRRSLHLFESAPARLTLMHACLCLFNVCLTFSVEMQTDGISVLMSHSVESSPRPRHFIDQYECTGMGVACVCVQEAFFLQDNPVPACLPPQSIIQWHLSPELTDLNPILFSSFLMAKLNSLEGVVSNPLELRFLNRFIFVQNLLFVVNKFHLPGHEKLIILIHLPLRTIGKSTSLQFQPLGMWSFKDLRSQHSMLSLWNSLIMRLGYKLGLLACLIVPNPCHFSLLPLEEIEILNL